MVLYSVVWVFTLLESGGGVGWGGVAVRLHVSVGSQSAEDESPPPDLTCPNNLDNALPVHDNKNLQVWSSCG